MDNNTGKATKEYGLWNRYFFTIVIVSVFSGLCTQLFNSTISLQIEHMGGETTLTGVLAVSFTVAAAIFRVVGGRIVDKKGRRAVIVLGNLIFALASLLFAFVERMELHTAVAYMLVLRFAQGVGFAMCSTALMVAVADVVPKARMAEGIGYFGLGSSLTQAVGPSIALVVFYSSLGFSGVAVASMAALLVSALVMFFCRYEEDPKINVQRDSAKKQGDASTVDAHGKPVKRIWVIFEKKAVPCGIVQFFTSLATGVTIGYLTLYAARAGIANAGLYFTFSAISVVLARLLTGKISDKYGAIFSIAPGYVFGIVGFLFLILSAQTHVLYYLAGVFLGFCSGMTAPALNAEAIRRSPAHRKGAASATYQMPTEVAFAISALGSGVLIEYLGFQITFAISIFFFAVSLVLSFIFFAGKRNVSPDAP